MMMKQLLQLSLIFFSATVFAQNLQLDKEAAYVPQQKHFTALSFQVEELCYVQLENAMPQSQLHFYSATIGGKHLKIGTSNAQGFLSISFHQTQMPAFVLNKASNEQKNPKGFIAHFEKKEFIVKDIELKRKAQGYKLSFKTIADQEQSISYQITQIREDGTVIMLQEGIPSANWKNYVLLINYCPKTKYQISFFNQGELRYVQDLDIVDKEDTYVIYPTFAQEQLNIDFKTAFKSGQYTISNLKGQVMQEGKLTEQFTTLGLEALAKGSYVIFVELNGVQLKGKQFVKQ